MERGRGTGGLDDRQRHLPHAGAHRCIRAGPGSDVRRLGARRAPRVVRCAHLRRARGDVPALWGRLRLHPRRLRTAAGVSVRVDRALADPRVGARGDRHTVRGIPAPLTGIRSEDRAQCHVRPLRRGRGDRPHGIPQLRGRALELTRPQPHDGGEVRRAHAARAVGVCDRARRFRSFQPGSWQRPTGVVWAGARLGPLGVRRLGRPLFRRRRGARPRAQPAAGAGIRDAQRDRDLPPGERRVPLSHSDRPDGAFAPGRGRRGAVDRGAARCGPRGRAGDARHVQHVGGVDPHLAAHLLRDGGRRLAVQPGGPSASALSHAVGLDRRDRGARRSVGAAAQLRPAGRSVRGRDFPLLCARGSCRPRAAAAPA